MEQIKGQCKFYFRNNKWQMGCMPSSSECETCNRFIQIVGETPYSFGETSFIESIGK